MSDTEPNTPAFPCNNLNLPIGLTKREYFAAMAMIGLTAYGDVNSHYTCSEIPKMSVNMADLLIFELRDKNQDKPGL